MAGDINCTTRTHTDCDMVILVTLTPWWVDIR